MRTPSWTMPMRCEVVKACPVFGEVERLEDVNRYRRTSWIKYQRRIAEVGAPTGVYQPSADVAIQPATFKSVELMMVWATRCQGSVRRQPVKGSIRGALAVLIHPAPPIAQIGQQATPNLRRDRHVRCNPAKMRAMQRCRT